MARKLYSGLDFAIMGFYLLLNVSLVVALTWSYGWLYLPLGILTLILFYFIKKAVLWCFFRLESLGTLDEFFFIDWPQNRANILTVMKIDKIENYEEFKRFVESAVVVQHSRCRSKIVKVPFLAEYFFKEMNQRELQSKLEFSFVRVDSLHTD